MSQCFVFRFHGLLPDRQQEQGGKAISLVFFLGKSSRLSSLLGLHIKSLTHLLGVPPAMVLGGQELAETDNENVQELVLFLGCRKPAPM